MQLDNYVKSGRGKQMHLAKAINAQPQLVYQWATGLRPIPIERCVAIEQATGGVVSRRDLRPNDWWKIWPELREPDDIARPDAGDSLEETKEIG